MSRIRLLLVWCAGALEALLAARLVVQLLAARPDNPFVIGLLASTDFILRPFMWLDAAQPRFGAILELSTLVLLLLIPLITALVWRLTAPRQ